MSVNSMPLTEPQDECLTGLHSPILAFIRLTALSFVLLAFSIIQWVFLRTSRKWAARFPTYTSRLILKVLGIKLIVEGTPSPDKPTLFLSNHISYLDMVAISAVIEGSYIGKMELSQWPVLGGIMRLVRTIFIDRRPQFAAKQKKEILQRLSAKDNIIMFAEGTTSDGTRVLPFKSSILGVAEDEKLRDLPVQPIGLAYIALDNIPMGRHFRPLYAWYGDMGFFSHLWQWAGIGKITISMFFHKPVTINEFHSRKKIADYCYQSVQLSVASAYSSQSQNILIASEKKKSLRKFIKKIKK